MNSLYRSFCHAMFAIIVVTISVLCTAASAPAAEYKIFDGTARRIVVSHQWSWRLGNFFDSDFLKKYGFTNISVSKKEYNDMPVDDTLGIKKGSLLLGFPGTGEPVPDIMIVLVSSSAVTGPQDSEHIHLGVKKIQKLVEVLKSKGVKEVFVSSRHRRMARAHSAYTSAINDEIRDTLYLDAYNKLVNKTMAINVMGPSMQAAWAHLHYDWEHPTNYGGNIYASTWLKALLRYDGGREDLIARIDKDLATSRTNGINEKEQYVLSFQSPAATPVSVEIGDKITLNVHLKSTGLYSAYLKLRLTTFVRGSARMYVIFDSLSYKSLDNTVSFTIPDSAFIAPYGGTLARKIKIEGDSAVFQIAQHNSSIYEPTWVVTPTFKIFGSDGKPTVGVAQNVSVHPVVLQGNAPITSDLLGRNFSVKSARNSAQRVAQWSNGRPVLVVSGENTRK